jgi:hypothetical protein
MKSMSLITQTTYRPEYNPETKQYEDVNPIPRYQKGFRYVCLCNHSNTLFTKSSDFTQHFKTKAHVLYVKEYERNTKDLTDAQQRIKELQIQLESKHHEIKRLERDIRVLRYNPLFELD